MPVFQPVDPKLNFPQAEAAVLKFWKDRDIFHKSLKQREGSPYWCFYEGPPTANGKPHPGHVLTRVVKDLFPRYKTMCGCYVPRKAGWDTHGLPVEIEVEKELKLNGKAEVEKYGVEPFVRKCMESVFRYTNDWEQLTDRIGFWIDLDTAYVTYHQSYVESVWWSLKELHARGLLYRGPKILPWCPH
jgi:isoleucyl-tRNA synthetase